MQILETMPNNKITLTQVARQLGVSRSSLYYVPKRPKLDEEIKSQIESVLSHHPSYGHKRIALDLKLNKKRILRVMKYFGIKPHRRRVKKTDHKEEIPVGAERINVTKILCPLASGIVWVSDFTYIKYQSKFIYLATIMDMFTREIVGWNISRYHNQDLILGALRDALQRNGNKPPQYLHSDQGSEYDAEEYSKLATGLGITLSFSDKSSPWQNGFQESFFSHFKVDLGDPNRFEDLAELIESIHLAVNYYNTQRIHTKLKMTPYAFRKLQDKSRSDTVSKIMGT